MIIDSKPGDSVYIDNSFPKESFLAPLSDNRFKKAIALFKTDDNCIATFNGVKMQTSLGNVMVKSLTNARIS